MIDWSLTPSTKRRDRRGFLVDFLKGSELKTNRTLGQIYFVTFDRPGMVRGNHYHKTKNEWFVVVKGRIEVRMEDIGTGERKDLVLNGDQDEYLRIFIGKGVAHAFRNISDTAMMLDYADKPYHPDRPDTIPYQPY